MPRIVLTFLSEEKNELLFKTYPLVISLLTGKIDPKIFLEDFRKNKQMLVNQQILTSEEADKLEQIAVSRMFRDSAEKISPAIVHRLGSIREKSHGNLKQILIKLNMDGPEFEAAINSEADSIREDATVSIYFRGPYSLIEILNGKRYKKFNDPKILKRVWYWVRNSDSSETAIQKKMGIHPEGIRAVKEPPVVYGAMFLENKRDFSSIYGKSLFLLRKDRIKNRTTFTYGDSVAKSGRGLGWSADYPLVWDDAVIARAAMNINGDYTNNYVEAQIMGGVTAKDVKEIWVNQRDIPHWEGLLFKPGVEHPKGYKIIEEMINEGREKFPWIKFEII